MGSGEPGPNRRDRTPSMFDSKDEAIAWAGGSTALGTGGRQAP